MSEQTTQKTQAETEVEAERKLLAEADDKATRRVAKLRQDIVTVARRGELAHRKAQLDVGRLAHEYVCCRMAQVDTDGNRITRNLAIDEVASDLSDVTGSKVKRDTVNRMIRHWHVVSLLSPDNAKNSELADLGACVPVESLKAFSSLLERVDADTSKEGYRVKGEYRPKAVALWNKCTDSTVSNRPKLDVVREKLGKLLGTTSAKPRKEASTEASTDVQTDSKQAGPVQEALKEVGDSKTDGTIEPGQQTTYVAAMQAHEALRRGPAEQNVTGAYREFAKAITADQLAALVIGVSQRVQGDLESEIDLWARLSQIVTTEDSRISSKIEKFAPVKEAA